MMAGCAAPITPENRELLGLFARLRPESRASPAYFRRVDSHSCIQACRVGSLRPQPDTLTARP